MGSETKVKIIRHKGKVKERRHAGPLIFLPHSVFFCPVRATHS